MFPRYNAAMRRSPHARNNELHALDLSKLPQNNDKTWLELGSGDGYLTKYLLNNICGAYLYALESSNEMAKNIQNNPSMTTIVGALSDIPLECNSVDVIISLATWHHVGNKKQVCKEVRRVLKPCGLFLIGDVNDGTPTQNFFENIVAKYCSTGHDYDFSDKQWLKYLASSSSSLEHVNSRVVDTPWMFETRGDMLFFVKNIFSLDISDGILEAAINKYLGVIDRDGFVTMNWQLGYHLLQRPNRGTVLM